MGEYWHYIASTLSNKEEVFILTINSGSDATFTIGDTQTFGNGGMSPYHSYFGYDWEIDWGDGTGWHRYTKSYEWTMTSRSGITYNQSSYSANTIYRIKIRSYDNSNGWLSAFCMAGLSSANNAKLLKVDGVINKKMLVRDNDFSNIIADQSTLPDYERYRARGYCCEWFYECTNLVMGDTFNFSNDINKVLGKSFYSMFYGCTSLTMNSNFNLPQNITEICGIYNNPVTGTPVITDFDLFTEMFYKCSSLTMNNVFNLPSRTCPNENSTYGSMFRDCTSLTMNNIFNLPQDRTNVGNNDGFCSYMFKGCSSLTMNNVFNLPPNITIFGTSFCAHMFEGCTSLTNMNNVFNLPQNATKYYTWALDNMFSRCIALTSLNSVFKLPKLTTFINSYTGSDSYWSAIQFVFYQCSALQSGAIQFLSGWTTVTSSLINNGHTNIDSAPLNNAFNSCLLLNENITTNIPCIAITPNEKRYLFTGTQCTYGTGVSNKWYSY